MIARLLLLALSAIALAATPSYGDEPLPWKAAAAKAVITPQKMLWMGGYSARTGPAEGTLQDLHAKVLAIEDATGARLVVVTLDLVYVTRELRAAVEEQLHSLHDLPPESLLMNASHTHCGPMIRYYRPPGKDREEVVAYANIPEDQRADRLRETHEYLAFVEKKIIEAVETALENLEPVNLLYSKGRCGFAMNRRLPAGNSFKNSPNPEGPVDHDVPVLQVRDADDNLTAVLFGYACHNTTLSVMEFNGDYAGFAQNYLEEDHPGAVALFVQGCGGDQNPYPRRMIYFAERHGRSLATAVEAGLIANPLTVTGPLRAAYGHATLDYAPPPTRAQLEGRLKTGDRYDQRHAEYLLEELDTAGELPKSYPCPVQVIRFGDSLTLAAIGGEACVDYSLRLKRELAAPSRAVWVCGYSNDGFGYTPSKRVVEEGGYEGATSMRYIRQNLHPGPWAPTIEERIIGKIHELNTALDK